jgi:hypothetical protein
MFKSDAAEAAHSRGFPCWSDLERSGSGLVNRVYTFPRPAGQPGGTGEPSSLCSVKAHTGPQEHGHGGKGLRLRFAMC